MSEWNDALEAAAKVLTDSAERLLLTGRRTNQVDRHTADVLLSQAKKVRGLKNTVFCENGVSYDYGLENYLED